MIHDSIQSQNLSNSSIDEDVVVPSEEVYMKTVEAMLSMNKSISNEKHKSYDSDIDIDLLNECRTIVPSGIIQKPEVQKNGAEIDINKAFTNAFTSIERIPIFRQFDIWRKWSSKLNINDMPTLMLYMVEVANVSVTFTSLIYGKFLKKLI